MTHRAPVFERSGASSTTHTPRDANAMSGIARKRALTVGEDAAFLWVSRSAVARSSAVTFDVLARLDERISKLVFKLSERSVLAERFLQHEHAAFKAGLAFVTAVVALRSGTATVFEELVARLESDAELLAPLASALAWLEYGGVREYVERLHAAGSPSVRRLGLIAAVAHRIYPGGALDRALEAENPALRASALEAAGRLGTRDLQPRLRAAFEAEDAACRFWAAWSAVRLGDRAGISVLGQFAAKAGPLAKPACDIGMRALEPGHAVRAHGRLMAMTSDKRLGVLAAGIVGDPALATWLLDEMESPRMARAAGAAFCLMTGLDLCREDLDARCPLGAVASEVDSSDASQSDEIKGEASSSVEGSLAAEADDDLVWPDTARIREWWTQNRRHFVPGRRYLAGLPIRSSDLATVLRTGNQQQRAAAALELALLNEDDVMLDVTAPAHRQSGASNRVLKK